MRLAVLSALVLAAAAPRSGCGEGPVPSHSDADCLGKWCGAPCNPCAPDRVCPTFAPTACDGDGHCATDTPWLCYDPCAGKACGAECHLCPAGKPDCFETMEVKACNAAGACVPRTPELTCPAP